MRKPKASLLLLLFALSLSTCTKKPESIKVQVYNPFYDQGVAGAEITLVETKENSFTKNFECQVLQEVRTDAQGEALIEKAKLKKKDNYTYVVKVNKAYNETVRNAGLCGNFLGDHVLPKTNEAITMQLIYMPPFQTGWSIKITNLKGSGFGSSSKDSISVRVFQDFGFVEGWDDQFNGSQFNGSKREIGSLNLNPAGVPINADSVSYPQSQFFPTPFGKHKVVVYKKKSGVVTTNTYTETILHTEFIHEFVVAW